jgi:superfamily II DNA or RNA helicase
MITSIFGDDFRPTFATNRPKMGETVAAAINALLEGTRKYLAELPDIAIATAYFNPGGFWLLADELEQVGKVRLLLGAEPVPNSSSRRRAGRDRRADRDRLRNALEGHARSLVEDRDFLGFTPRDDAKARRLVAWLRSTTPDGSPRVQVRRYGAGFLHGKAFIVDTRIPHVISGSSNFTQAGLSTNRELNLGQYTPEAVANVRNWFNELWTDSQPYDLGGLYEARWSPHPPWHVFLRMLQELYGTEVEQEAAARGAASQLGLTRFQADGVWRAKRILNRHHGVIVADEVGLGKTYIAGDLIRDAMVERRQRVLVVTPAALRDSTWRIFLRDTDLHPDIVSYEQLVAEIEGAGTLGSALQSLDRYAMVVVDEAHALRNAATKRAEAIRRLLAGQPPKDLVLLTATPVNNSLYDLYNLISYFVLSDATFLDAGISSLKAYFDRAMEMSPDDLSPAHLFDVLDQIAVRRTRRFVKHNYIGDKVVINGVRREIRFPTPHVRRIDYDLDAALPGLFDQLATALGQNVLATEVHNPRAVLLESPGEVLSLARYVPSRFRLDGTGELPYEAQNAGLLRSALLKRFESSAYAFQQTVRKMLRSHERFLDAVEEGKVLTGDALREWSISDSDDVEEFLDTLDDQASVEVDNAGDYDVAALRAAVQADRNLLRHLYDQTAVLSWDQDPKTLRLVDALAEIAAEAELQGRTESNQRDRRKVLIFSYFTHTVEHLADRLHDAVERDDRLGVYRRRIATASGRNRAGRAQVIAGFAPKTAGGTAAADLYDILIATDVLSEGINLQQARHIINYDLPWNPMRLVQRHGRIDRIGSLHDEVFIRCYFPDRQLEKLLGLEERLRRKLKQAAAATGVGPVLPGFPTQEVTFTETRDEIERLRREDATLFEEGSPSALSGEEYRRKLERAFADDIGQQIVALPWGTGSGFVRTGAQQPGFVFCTRIGNHGRPWFRYVPLKPDYSVQTDESTNQPLVIDDTLACLAHADPEDTDFSSLFAGAEHEALYQAAFGAWTVAKAHIVKTWNHNADPVNLQPQVPRVMLNAAKLVRRHGYHLGERQGELIERLEAPYSPCIQRAVREVLAEEHATPRRGVDRLAELADLLRLTKQPLPEPLPEITDEDVHLVCWMAVLPSPLTMDETTATKAR